MCHEWIKDYKISTNYGPGFKYLHSENVLIMKLCFNDIYYITLVLHINGNIECIIDDNIQYKDIKGVINLCNNYIQTINNKFMKKTKLEKFNENFFLTYKDKTNLDFFNCTFFYKLEQPMINLN